MNPIQSLFRKYDAVPATDAGPSWSQATETALLGWFRHYAGICRCGWIHDAGREATAAERAAALPIYNEIVAEIATRAKQPDASAGIMAAHFRAGWPTGR
jgi:hypothetical protein